MKDNLERFIEKNREAFDSEYPSDALWSNIQKSIPVVKPKTKIHWWKYAAAAMLFMICGVGIGFFINSAPADQQFIAAEKVRDSEQHYTQLVNNKMDELSNYDFDKSVLKDLELLDEIHLELKEELVAQSGANSEIVIQAMMKNYQVKLNALERILGKLKEKEINANKNKNSIIY